MLGLGAALSPINGEPSLAGFSIGVSWEAPGLSIVVKKSLILGTVSPLETQTNPQIVTASCLQKPTVLQPRGRRGKTKQRIACIRMKKGVVC